MIEISFPQKHKDFLYSYIPRSKKYKKALSLNNIYIFRNKKGKILKIYNQGNHTIKAESLRPVKDNYFSPEFLRYQYTFFHYKDSISQKTQYIFVYKNEHNLIGLFSQHGEIIVEAIHQSISLYTSHNILVGNLYAKGGHYNIYFLDNPKSSIKNTFIHFSEYNSKAITNNTAYNKLNGTHIIIDLEYKKIFPHKESIYPGTVLYRISPYDDKIQAFNIDFSIPNRPSTIDIIDPNNLRQEPIPDN